MLQDKKSSFSWKLVVVYGSPYEDGKEAVIEELHTVMSSWQGLVMVGGDFNLVRFASDKSNANINYRRADMFNSWVHMWALLELNASNRKYTWTNNQDRLVMAKIDRIFVTTEWNASFPLASVKGLDRVPSDHNPLVVEAGASMFFGKKILGLKNGGCSKKVLLR